MENIKNLNENILKGKGIFNIITIHKKMDDLRDIYKTEIIKITVYFRCEK